jgi:hypothetical protein
VVLGFLAGFRDVIIILWALLSVVALVGIILATLSIYLGIKDLIRTGKLIADEDIRPMVAVTQDTVNNVAGTTRFLNDTVARPVIKGLAFIAGIRRALAILAGMRGGR